MEIMKSGWWRKSENNAVDSFPAERFLNRLPLNPSAAAKIS
jgi:hypothetical protein